MHRDSDLGAAAKVMFSLVTAAPAGAAIVGLGNTAVTFIRLPEATWKTYRAIVKTPRVGPVIKSTVALVLPIGIAATPPTALLLSTLVGLGYGFYKGCDYSDENGPRGLKLGVVKSAELVRKFNDVAVEDGFLKWLEDTWYEPLKEGEEPFDVPIIDGMRGLVSAVLAAPFEAVGLTLVVLRHWPRAVYEMYRAIWSWPDSLLMLTFSVAASALGLMAAVLVVPLAPVASLACGLGDTCVEGYRHGIRAAFKKGFERVRHLHEGLGAALAKMSGV